MVLGYWDGRGYDKLVPGDASTQTTAVNDMIATSGNWNDYCLPLDYAPDPIQPDKSEPPVGDEHTNDSVADFMKTSQSASSNYYGWSWYSHVDDAFDGYVPLVASDYTTTATNQTWGAFNWTSYQAEIDAGRPVVLLVDTDGNGGTDHFITAVGYSDDGGTNRYGCYNTWSTSLQWYEFREMASGRPWGIYGATLFQISANLPAAFGKTNPPNGGIVSTTAPTINWGISSGASSYEYCIDTSDNDTCNSSWVNVGNTNAAALSGLVDGMTHFWQVRARNSSGFTDANYGAWHHFAVDSTLKEVYLPLIVKNFNPVCVPLYMDNFDNPASGWPISDSESRKLEYLSGEYRILVKNIDWWVGVRPNFKATDYILEVDVRNHDGTYGWYGLMFGLADDWSGFYTFDVNPSGDYGIWKYNSSTGWTKLAGTWSAHINTGTVSNFLKIKREGSQIHAYANGHLLASVSDGTYTGLKYVGLYTGTFDQPNVDSRFDNFVVYPVTCSGGSGGYLTVEKGAFEIGEFEPHKNTFEAPDIRSR